ncbi:MAG: DEAD/DEAH box helicase, partial [Candidatus Zixiibacteriota bacterium]
PTPIQKESIPAGLNGDDIIAIAKTGSGKTIAYGVPLLQRLYNFKTGTALILVPTRELATQVDEAIKAINRNIKIRSTVLIGGASISMQMRALHRNPRIVIATPGRLMDHIERGTVDLSNVKIFILDEADRMLDMGFIPDVKTIIKSLPDKHQTMLFSATMPAEIEAIAGKLMENPTRVETDRSGTTPVEVSHEMFFIESHDKKRLLAVQLKQYTGPVLVFTRTKRMASKLTDKIKNMGFAAAEIHSDRSLEQRRAALEGFKRGRFQILVATDIAARGIDVSGIELVVNYDMPANSEDYVHRIGRTGRAGKAGHAISYASPTQKSWIRNLEKFMKIKLPMSTLPFLPSENLLLKEAANLNLSNELSIDKKVEKRTPMKNRAARRKSSGTTDSKKSAPRRTDSRKKDFKRKDFEQPKQKSKTARVQISQATDNKRDESDREDSFWSKLKKSWPSKKQSVGQGSRRKKRARRK